VTRPASRLRITPGGVLRGHVPVPGDKSVTHRALICAALAEGESTISGALDADDTRATAAALSSLGAGLDWHGESVRVRGTAGQPKAPGRELDLGNSGTGLRLLAGALAGRGVGAVLSGDASLRRRPMERIVHPLTIMGARIAMTDGHPPLTLQLGHGLRGIRYRLPVASAQVKSAVLLAGLAARGGTTVEDPYGTRDHTERLLPEFGIPVSVRAGEVAVEPGRLRGCDVVVPRDFSSAAFMIAAALLVPDSSIELQGVGVNPTRTGLLQVLARMGARVNVSGERLAGGEPVADLHVEAGRLKGTTVSVMEIPALIDELPVLMVLAAAADGATVIEGAGELRHKESDRIATMQAGLAALGIEMSVDGERLTIPGGGFRRGGDVDAAGDHRVAMSLALAGLAAPEPVTVGGARWIATSFPGFAERLAGAGVEAVA